MPVLLASGNSDNPAAKFDIFTADPAKTFCSYGAETKLSCADGSSQIFHGNPIDILEQQFDYPELDLNRPDAFPFVGGAIGYFAYDLLNYLRRLQSDCEQDIGLPSMLVGIYHWAVIINHREKNCFFVALESYPESRRVEVLECLTQSQSEAEPDLSMFILDTAFQSNFTKQQYQQAFQKILAYIYAGDCYQVNLSQRFSADYHGDPLHAFEKLHKLANAPFSAFIKADQGSVLCFSPERFLRVADGEVITQPIKGTRPRHPDRELDEKLLQELQNSTKDRAENLMIVDLLRNDLGRVCDIGSVKAETLFEAVSFSNVHHLVSTVGGKLRQKSDVFKLLKACFPGGSITGTPKIRAMEIINELETRQRSVYCGSIGYIGFDGNMDTNICIRTLVCDQERIHCWGGGGIVADSDPDQEYQETLDKISIFINNL